MLENRVKPMYEKIYEDPNYDISNFKYEISCLIEDGLYPVDSVVSYINSYVRNQLYAEQLAEEINVLTCDSDDLVHYAAMINHQAAVLKKATELCHMTNYYIDWMHELHKNRYR